MSLNLDLIYSDFNFTMDKSRHHKIYEFEKFRLDAAQMMLYRDAEEISLPPKAVETLLVLVERRGKILSKDDLMKTIWTDSIVEESNLAKYLHLLRKILGETFDGKPFIETFRRRGYRFNGEVNVRLFEANPPTASQNFTTFHEPTNGGVIREATTGKVVALADWRSLPEVDEKSSPAILQIVKETKLPEVNRKKIPVIGTIALGLLILALGFFAFSWFRSETPPANTSVKSIAVLPFVNECGNPDLDYLADGLSESVIDGLSQLPQLKVIARTSSFKFRGQNIDLQEAAAKLDAEAIVTGRLAQCGDDLLIRVEIIDTRENIQLWSGQYDRKATDALLLQKEIARAASEKLRLKLSGADAQRLTKNYTENAEAYQLYLRGRFLQNKYTPPDLYKSIEFYQQAVAFDPNFALAYVGLAESTGRISNFRDIPGQQNYKQLAREYALKAVSLDDQLPEAHAAYGSILSLFDYDFAGAEREYGRALELNPNYAKAHLRRGQLLSSFGRHDEALAEIQRGIELDPLSLEANSAYGEALFFARRYDESIVHLKKVLNLDANYFPAHRYLAFNYEMKGDYAARITETIKMNEISGAPERGEAMRKSFETEGWQGFLRDAADGKFDLHPYLTAAFCAELGKKDKAIAILEKIYEERGSELVLIKVDPRLDNLRDDPRFIDLMKQMNFE